LILVSISLRNIILSMIKRKRNSISNLSIRISNSKTITIIRIIEVEVEEAEEEEVIVVVIEEAVEDAVVEEIIKVVIMITEINNNMMINNKQNIKVNKVGEQQLLKIITHRHLEDKTLHKESFHLH